MTKHDFQRALRALGGARAPSALTPAVLNAVGLRRSYVKVATGIGDVFVALGDAGIAAVRRTKDAAQFERWYRRTFGMAANAQRPAPAALIHKMERDIAGERASRLQVDLRSVTPFERAVLEKAREIPRGETRPYSWIAREIGNPRAVRAVGSALAKNPVPLVIPCHRVVRADGSIGSYVFGSAAKRSLLLAEGAIR